MKLDITHVVSKEPIVIFSRNDLANGEWFVVRRRDGQVLYSSHSLFGCLRWRNVWGVTRL